MIIDIHTHSGNSAPGVIAIRNVSEGFENLSPNGHYSVGLHPWFLESATLNTSFEQLQVAAASPAVWAIGECGLDKVCDTDWQLQQEAFGLQIALANKLKMPLIIHCVRAFSEVQQLLRQHRVSVTVVFHGYNKSVQLAARLVEQGYYLSFGKSLQRHRMQQVLTQVPLSQVFLETDDSTLSIGDVYAVAAATLNTTVELLCLRLAENAQQVFGKGLNPI